MSQYFSTITSILTEAKGWLLGIVAAVTTIVVIINGLNYLHGNSGEKIEALSNIKKAVKMGGGIFALAAFALYVIGKFSAVK